MISKKIKKKKCEICGITKKTVLEIHHIIPRCDPRCTNLPGNLACLCSNCHNEVHVGDIKIIGVYNSTEGRKLMWFRKGETPPLEKEYWLIKENPLVVIYTVDE
jgi:5-methylcytosine-specific restriction endonuclease McrA